MCGINGIFAYDPAAAAVDRDELLRSREAQHARGPDGEGLWLASDRRIGLAHRRLAIIDLSEHGAQPMADREGRLRIVFNGEIYNYRELRAELIAAGEQFHSETDTEVLLKLYWRLGPAMVDRLRGMFAFAIWDGHRNGVFLARDPYGIKPLYYANDGQTLRFASQVQALMAGGAISATLDPAGVVGFLLWGSVPEPVTIQRDISLLQAGHTLWVDGDGAQTPQCYWNLADTVTAAYSAAGGLSVAQAREQACAALNDSVRAHMVADVPVGSFLSAGLDSSVVTGLARALTGHRLETLTLSFPEFAGSHNDEAPMAADIARHLDVANQVSMVDMASFDAEYSRFLRAMDQPTLDGINTWFVSKAAADAGLKVVLSGLGGDELLGGYASFTGVPRCVEQSPAWARLPGVAASLRHFNRHLWGRVTKTPVNQAGRLQLGGDYFGAYRLARGVMMPWDLPLVLDADFARAGLERLRERDAELDEGAGTELNGFGRVAVLEGSRYMRNQLLRDTDWVGMGHSLEIRVPLVDRQLTEQTVGLAAWGLLGSDKRILPECLPGGLPAAVLQRPKTGFTVPVWKWLRKSPELDGWKRFKALRTPRHHDYTRVVTAILTRLSGAEDILRRR